MTVSEPAMTDDTKSRLSPYLRLSLGLLGLLVVASAVLGFLDAHADQGGGAFNGKQIAVLTVMGALIALLAVISIRAARSMVRKPELIAPRERRARKVLWASFALGAVIGFAVVISDARALSSGLLYQGPIPAWVAVTLTAVFIFVLPWLSWLWKRSIDEHERTSAFIAAEVAAFAFMTLVPAWWLLWRGGLLPAPDLIIIYFGFTLIYSLVWLYRKFA